MLNFDLADRCGVRRRAFVLIPTAAVVLIVAANADRAGAADRGTPWPRHVIDNSSQGADGVRLADVNGDGHLDIATGWEEGGLVRAYLNPGPATARKPWPAVTVGAVDSPEDAVFVDLDADGAVDVVSCCEGDERSMFVHWAPSDPAEYLNPDSWQTEALLAAAGAAKWMFCLPIEIDAQNGVDLVAGAKGDGAQIGWFEAPADARDLAAWRWHPLRKAGWVMSLLAADMNGDGHSDIVASDRRNPAGGCLWLENPGPGAMQSSAWPAHHIGPVGGEVLFMDLSDVDGDGLTDALRTQVGEHLFIHRRASRDGAAWDTFPIRMPQGVGVGKAVRAGDIDLDGRTDLVISCAQARAEKSGVVWMSYRNRVTDPEWDDHEISGPEGVKYDLVELIDLDHDGDLDVLTCEEQTNLGLIWYENPARP